VKTYSNHHASRGRKNGHGAIIAAFLVSSKGVTPSETRSDQAKRVEQANIAWRNSAVQEKHRRHTVQKLQILVNNISLLKLLQVQVKVDS
jgi:hypothetical protein